MKKVSLMGVLFGMGLSWGALATSFMERSFPDAVGDAPIIVRGVVGMSYSDYGKAAGDTKRLFTFYEIQPTEVFKGAISSRSLVMRQLGGSKDGVSMEVPGTAKFSRGEEVVVMLGSENADGSYDVRGLMMGKFTVEKVDGKEYLRGPGALTPQDVSDSELVHPEEGQKRQAPPHYTIESLREIVQQGNAAPGASIPSAAPSTSPATTGSTPVPESNSAPGLQPEAAGDGGSSPSSSGKWGVGAGLIALWLIVRSLRRRSKR